MQIWDDFKAHTGLALLFLSAGFCGGLGAYKYVSSFFNADVVLHGSYIYKSEIEKTHIPVERYTFLIEDLRASKSENDILKKQNAQLQASQSVMSASVCQRYGNEANSIMSEQQRAEMLIEKALSIYTPYSRKDQENLQVDAQRAQELRRYSELLNQQLIQVRGEIAKCGR